MGNNFGKDDYMLPEDDWRVQQMTDEQRKAYYDKFEVKSWIDRVGLFLYINLESRVDRNDQMLELLKKLEIPETKIQRVNAIKDDPGYRGCTKSHFNAIEFAMASNEDYVCIMEDDLMLCSEKDVNSVHKRIKDSLSYLNYNFDVVYLAMSPIKLKPVCENFHKVDQALAMPAYIVHKSYLPQMLQIYSEALLKGKQHDLITQLYQSKGKWYGFYPALFKQRPGFSDIEQRNVDYSHLEIDGVMIQ